MPAKKATKKKGTKKGTKKATKKRKSKKSTKRAASGSSKSWSAGEVSTLRKRYRAATTSQIARELRRTLSSVKSKARALGLTKGGRRAWS